MATLQISATERQVRQNKAKFVLRKIWPYKQPGNFLDFGCGKGFVVQEARLAGWNAYGLELNRTLAAAANAHWGIDTIFSCTLSELERQLGPYFDVINASRVFEHLTDPHGTAKALTSLLRQGGILSLDMPNIRAVKVRIYGGDMINPSGHLYHFSADTITKLLLQVGLRVVEAKTSYTGVHLTARVIRNAAVASFLSYALYRLPTFGSTLNVVAVKD